MGMKRRVCPHNAYNVITVRATDEQWARWYVAAQSQTMTPHLGTFLAAAGDFYAARLKARLELAHRLEKEGKL